MFASCSKDDNNESESSEPVSSILVKKITDIEIDGSSSTINYEYNGNKIVSITEDGLVSKYTYTGDYITKIEELDTNGKVDLTTEYSYTNGKLTSSIRKNTNAKYYYKTRYVHNADGTVIYDNFRGIVETGVEQEYGATGKYTLQDGNIVKLEVSYYGDESSYVYEYDTKKHPLKNVTGLGLLLDDETLVNNVIKKTSTSGSGDKISTSITTYSYKYDANDYPTEKVESYQSGNSISTQTTQYTY
ncbi:hypothetical protein IRZ71_09165 [Flavobacterium sp. ANB]|uniref:hypothetical protein n=1 Tax=unclassified Flavobacterium TaxID=196869 RepID=UPI0012B6B8B0|nr:MULTISPECIES: hypothetical protein [unclassified Flavobacterium]MBF4516513.1 hypothetical protein [Flavobacterium sp. ANB]MTD69590.1 hypothetical protein [Flavobacterium sp. LC2016-13]